MLPHLIKGPQRIEPKLVLWFRRIVIILSLILLIIALSTLCIRVLNELPTVSTTIKTDDKISAPTNVKSCDDSISQPTLGSDIDFPFIGRFSPKHDIGLTKYSDPGPYYVYLHMYVNTTGLSFNDTAQDSTFRMIAFDAEKDLFYSNSTSPFEASLFYSNKYLLARNSQYIFLYNRKIRKEIDKQQELLSMIGFPSKYKEPLNYIESNIEPLSMILNSSDQPYSVVRVNPRDFTIVEEEEQSCCGIKEKTQKKLLKDVHSINTDDLESLIQKVNDIENFHNYLKHNVVDTSLFVSIQQEQQEKGESK
ncbi:4721_t:CDS:2 [Gigaspora margarita]|uniref:4721_t:CDS:1 n=1 Tax=Gigaspora margarita TaxID=4874 RepID=A0ABM8W0U9_GIGMA|nr:4721_t:CDS:2 [Gigaspora margarita]